MTKTAAGARPVDCHVRPLVERLRSMARKHAPTGVSLYDEAADELEKLAVNAAVRSLNAGHVSRAAAVAVEALDASICEAVTAAVDAGVPRGLVVGVLHGHALQQTAAMVDAA